MSDPTSITWLDSIKTLPNLIKEIYGDLAKPGVQQAGKSIGSLFKIPNLLLSYIDLADDKQMIWRKRNLERYRDKVAVIPFEKTCEVPPEIGVPILEKLSYTSNEDIADLFTELLAKASSIDTISQAHPSYVQFISMLSADEVKLIMNMRNILQIQNFIPYIQLKIQAKDHLSYINLSNYLTSLELKIDLLFKDNIDLYLDNFESMGILSNTKGEYKLIDGPYNILYNAYIHLALEKIKTTDISSFESIVEFSRGYFQITQLGKSFIESCTSKSSIQPEVHLGFINQNIEPSIFKIGDRVKLKNNHHYNNSIVESILSENEICIKNNYGKFYLFFGDSVRDLERI